MLFFSYAKESARMTDRYRWIALSNTTLGMLLATLNASSLIIALPVIFRGIRLDPWTRATSATCSGS